MRSVSFLFAGTTIVVILLATSAVLIPLLPQVLAASSCVHACTIHVGSGPTGIAFDPKNGNLYVTNSRDKTVSVISGQNNTVIRTIPCCVQYTYNKVTPWGIAFDSANGNLYVTNSGDNTVTAISGQNNNVIGSITVGKTPRAIAFDSANDNLYVDNFNNNTVSVISPLLTKR
ncbi:MAG: YncE family protein [Candidatus Nitrosopolaris sp.]